MSAVFEPQPNRDESSLGATTYSRVHKAILADIVSGHFAPGARLKIADLCARYQLSPMPIREALQQLQGEGLVVMSPHKGASVRTLDRRFLAEVYDMRAALCTVFYRDAIATADPAFDEALLRIQNQFDDAMERGDVKQCNQRNRDLHYAIESRCQNREAHRLGQKYSDLTGSLRDMFGFNPDRLRDISKEHWKMIDAIRARDYEASISAAQDHIRRAEASMGQHFS